MKPLPTTLCIRGANRVAELLAFACVWMAGVATGGTYLVTNTNDSGPGSLRQAILDANASGSASQILCTNVSGTILLQSALAPIAHNTTLAGPGREVLAVSGINAFQVLSISSSASVSIAGVTVANGVVTNGGGGGIVNDGTLLLTDCLVVSNRSGSAPGGGIFSRGNLTLVSSLVVSNHASGPIIVSPGAEWSVNRLSGIGGGIHIESGSATLSNCTLSGNIVTATANISSLSQPYPGRGVGGAIFVKSGMVSLLRSTISSNFAFGGPGQVFGFTGMSGADAFGAGICLSNGSVNLVNCTLSGNATKGGSGGYGAHYGGNGGNAYGGALSMVGGTANLTHCTVHNNWAAGGSGGFGDRPGLGGSGWGEGIYTATSTVTIVNSILQSGYGKLTSLGRNLIEQTYNTTGLSSDDITNVPAQLGSLRNNGGFTFTQAPQSNSPAINAAISGYLLSTDQRGFSRPFGAAGDLGAVELYPTSFILNPPVRVNAAFHLHGIGVPLTSYRLQAATNLGTWFDLSTNTTPPDGNIDFIDSANTSRRFYRLSIP